MRRTILLAAATAIVTLGAPAASAYTFTVGGTRATACYNAATNGLATDEALRTCDGALAEDALSAHDRASTYVNRGALYIGRGTSERAMQDFDAALAIEPDNADAHANRGVALLNLQNFQEAIAELNRGISGQPTRPERAYFARARAHEETGDIRGAYNDYRAATQLAPSWEPARLELARFTVRGH